MTESDSPTQSKRRLRRLFGAVTVLSVILFAAVVGYHWLIPASPFAAQNRVLDRIPWDYKPNEPYNNMANLYTWLDNDTVAYLVPNKDGKLPAVKQRVALGKTFPAEPLPDVLTSLEVIEIIASPDGTGLAITGWDANGNGQCQIFSGKRDGKPYQFALGSPGLYWLADSQSLIGVNGDSSEAFRYTMSDNRFQRLPSPFTVLLMDTIDTQGNYYSVSPRPFSESKVDLASGSIWRKQSQTYMLQKPRDLFNLVLESVSPQGDRLLWRAHLEELSWTARLWGKVTRRTPDPVEIQHWYTTDTQGNDARTVYSLTPAPNPGGYGKSLYFSPKWLPDGKHLSVVHEGALYVIPVR